MIDLKGRTAIVFGVANKRSIAWAIAQKLNEAGARLLITYQNERLRLDFARPRIMPREGGHSRRAQAWRRANQPVFFKPAAMPLTLAPRGYSRAALSSPDCLRRSNST